MDWKTMDVDDLVAGYIGNHIIAEALGMRPSIEVPPFTMTKDAAFQLVEYPIIPVHHHLKLEWHSPDVAYAYLMTPSIIMGTIVGRGEAQTVELAICRAWLDWKQSQSD